MVITAASHGYSDGDRVRIADVGGMTAVNGREFTIDVLTSNTFSLLDEDGSSYGAYTSGGTATKIPASDFRTGLHCQAIACACCGWIRTPTNTRLRAGAFRQQRHGGRALHLQGHGPGAVRSLFRGMPCRVPWPSPFR